MFTGCSLNVQAATSFTMSRRWQLASIIGIQLQHRVRPYSFEIK
jgi:hypothetical protein